MEEVLSEGQKYKETLWEIMVSLNETKRRRKASEEVLPFRRDSTTDLPFPLRFASSFFFLSLFQVDMTPAGKRIVPGAGEQEMRLLDVKYKIFRESIDVQRKWRAMVDEAYGERQ